MAPRQGSDPAVRQTPTPLAGDGRELLGLVVDDRYRLDAVVGRGGMGLVFRAMHLVLRREVAVKILHPSLAASHDVRSRFEREALAVGKVDHPNCVATFDVGRLADGSLYLAMELLEGRQLGEVLAHEGRLAPKRALHILRHILRGLSGIHNAGLVHRDIKPDNIFLTRQGEDVDFAKILDFGIAKPIVGELVDDGVRLTQAGMAFGTPIYMSPEQALGNKLDGRADLYAAAVIGYEMLAGQLPFYSDDRLEVMSMHVAKPVPEMRTRMPPDGDTVPPTVERLIAKGLTKKPEERYASAEDFIAAIEEVLGAMEVEVAKVHHRTLADAQPTEVDISPIDHNPSRTLDDLLLQLPGSAPVQLQPLPVEELGESVPRPRAMPRAQARWILYVATLAGAIVFGVAAAVVTTRSEPVAHLPAPAPTPEAVPPQVAVPSEPPTPAAPHPDEPPPANVPQDPLALGHARAAQGETAAALAAYDRALSLAPASSTDTALRQNLAAMTKNRDPKVVTTAFEMWLGRTDDPAAIDAILEAAVSKSIKRRRAARPVIDRFKLDDRVDWVTSYRLDLVQEPTCKMRREAVARLRALKKPAAMPALERAIAKRQRRRNACLVKDARAAIRFLKRRAPERK